MIADKIFYDLKLFKTDYNFTKKESTKHFDNALISGCGKYMDEYEKETSERIHVVFSWALLFKYTSYIFLGFTLLALLQHIFLPIVATLFSISLIFKIIDFILGKKIQRIQGSYEMTKSILKFDNYSFLEETRRDLLK